MKDNIKKALEHLQHLINTPNVGDFAVGTSSCSYLFSVNKDKISADWSRGWTWISLGEYKCDEFTINCIGHRNNLKNIYIQTTTLEDEIFSKHYQQMKKNRGIEIDANSIIRDQEKNYLEHLIKSDGFDALVRTKKSAELVKWQAQMDFIVEHKTMFGDGFDALVAEHETKRPKE